MNSKIKFFVTDVDGTLTDGKIYLGSEGELCKAFHVQDGFGLKHVLQEYSVMPVVITARTSKIVERRCQELDICHCYQGVFEKLKKVDEILEYYTRKDKNTYTYKNVAYIGDDILDLECMKPIKEGGGMIGCPQNAVTAVKEIANYVCERAGGNGAVREFIEWLL